MNKSCCRVFTVTKLIPIHILYPPKINILFPKNQNSQPNIDSLSIMKFPSEVMWSTLLA